MRFPEDNPPKIYWFDGVKYALMGGSRKYYLSQAASNRARKNPKGLHVAVWEYTGSHSSPIRHKEELKFEFVQLATRSYK